jgi:hypothetical protein
MSASDEWDQIIILIRRYALRKYGDWAAGITIHLPFSRQNHFEPFPARDPIDNRSPGRSAVTPWGSGPEPKHTDNFSAVYWPGRGTFHFYGEKQQAVVAALWAARAEGSLEVSQNVLLRAADSDGARLHDLFRGHPAWGKLVLRGHAPGSYTLPPQGSSADDLPLAEEGERPGESC